MPRTLGRQLAWWAGSVLMVGILLIRLGGLSILGPIVVGGVAALVITIIRHRRA